MFDSLQTPVISGGLDAGDVTSQIAAEVPALITAQVGVANSADVKAAMNAAGNTPLHAVRTWGCFNGTVNPPSLYESSNVVGMTYDAVGRYSVTIDVDFPDANYAGGQTSSGDGNNMHQAFKYQAAGSFSLEYMRQGTGWADVNRGSFHITR